MSKAAAGKAAAKPAALTKVILPQGSKEAKLFKDLAKCTEARKFKRAVRCADLILKKYPDHGETLALKGLNAAYQDKKEEAFDCVKRGVKADITSFLCWQMHGLVHRHYREHIEAARCFQMAIRNCPPDKNREKWGQLLRELALEQVMSGDYRGFAETKKKFLEDKPGIPVHWMACTVAAHFLEDLAGAVRYIDAYEFAAQQSEKRETFEEKYAHSELMMYRITLLEQLGEFDRALSLLNRPADLLDKLAVQELRGSILLKRKDFAEAEKVYRQLLEGNPEQLTYHRRLLESLQMASFKDGEEKLLVPEEKLLEHYTHLGTLFPKAHAVQHFPLRFLHGESFKSRFDAAIRPLIRKGVPALFNSCKGLYHDATRVKIIEDLANSYVKSLRESNRFPDSTNEEDPTTLLWALVFAAQHYNEVEQWTKAFELIDEAIKHTPTAIDLYVFKSRFFKKAGDVESASQLMEKARQLDLADRYLNTRSSRYLLRANHPEQAERVVSLFTTDMETGISNLNEMQVAWWRQNLGEAFVRQGQMGLALKAFRGVEKDYDQVFEDQADFHGYCLRKQTLRAYLDLMHLEKNLHGQRAYARAIRAIADVYLQIHRGTGKAEAATEVDAAEQKKAEAKRKKEAARKAEEEEAAKKQQARMNARRKGRPPPVDNDPTGEQLLKVTDPLAEAAKYVRKVYHSNTKRVEVQLTAFEVFYAQKRLLLALQALKRAYAAAPTNSNVHKAAVRYFLLVDSSKDLNSVVASVIKAERDSLIGSRDLAAFNKAYADANASSVAARAAAAEMSVLLDPSQKAAAVKILSDPSGKGTVADFVDAHRLLSSWDAAAGAAYKETVHNTRLPYSTYFGYVPPKVEEEKDD